jgi:hypothetical protein
MHILEMNKQLTVTSLLSCIARLFLLHNSHIFNKFFIV